MTLIDKKTLESFVDDIRFGFVDEALQALENPDDIPQEILENDDVREAAIAGIRRHLIDSRCEGDINTAIRIRDLFKIPNNEIREDAKWGIENWITDRGLKFGEKIQQAFGIEESFMESKEIEEAKKKFERVHAEHEHERRIKR